MRIGVLGAGAVGCYVGGRLLAHGCAVVLVGRGRLRDELAAHGLRLSALDGPAATIDRVPYTTDIAELSGCRAVLVCTKSAATERAAAQLAPVLGDGLAISLQNGVRNPELLRSHLPSEQVVPGIVEFNVVGRGEGRFHQATTGALALQEHPRLDPVAKLFASAGLAVKVERDLAPAQWTKLLVNLNNAVSALTGAPTASLLTERELRRIVAELLQEGLGVLRASGIRPASFQGVPVGWMPSILRLPGPLVGLVTRRQVRVDAGARSSMWQDLDLRRATEVDFLNGEIVRLAERAGVTAPLNRRLVELVHEAEAAGDGSPGLSVAKLRGR